MYEIKFTKAFDRDYKKLIKQNILLEKRIDGILELLVDEPFHNSLRTHKVNTESYGVTYSSRITGDLRIIWDFIEGKTVILAIAIGGHSGKNKVYK